MKDNTNPIIVHYISRDKFTAGYINFMQIVMTEYEHCFITASEGFDLKHVEGARIIYTEHNRDLIFSNEIRSTLNECAVFIVSGCWMADWVALLPRRIQAKTYFHFWGGDFYGLRVSAIHDGRPHIRYFVYKKLTRIAFNNSRALVFLIDGEYEKFKAITGVENRHFVAPMPSDPLNMVIYSDYVTDEHLNAIPKKTVRIAVGHSATKECCHIDALNQMAKFRNEDVEIICPLSYGDETYGKEVIAYGRKIFGDKFKAVTRYMDKSTYIKLLSTCDIGINNSDRQHGMGNISMLLGTGAKFYMRSDTSMWDQFRNYGFYFYDIKNIKNLTFKEFCEFDTELRRENISVQDERLREARGEAKYRWSAVLNDTETDEVDTNVGGGNTKS